MGKKGAGMGKKGAGMGKKGAGMGKKGAGMGKKGAGMGLVGAGMGLVGAGMGLVGAGRGMQCAARGIPSSVVPHLMRNLAPFRLPRSLSLFRPFSFPLLCPPVSPFLRRQESTRNFVGSRAVLLPTKSDRGSDSPQPT